MLLVCNFRTPESVVCLTTSVLSSDLKVPKLNHSVRGDRAKMLGLLAQGCSSTPMSSPCVPIWGRVASPQLASDQSILLLNQRSYLLAHKTVTSLKCPLGHTVPHTLSGLGKSQKRFPISSAADAFCPQLSGAGEHGGSGAC